MKRLSTFALIFLLSCLSGIGTELRVVTFNIKANRNTNGDVTEALNAPGTPDHESVCRILARIDADVVCLQELANSDVAGGTNGGTNSDVHSLATSIGLPYVYIPTNAGVFDFALRNAILSRYPINNPTDIGSANYLDAIGSTGASGSRAKDVSRVMPATQINIDGLLVTIVGLHAKSGTGPANRFRRGVEFDRVGQYLSNNNLSANDNIIVLGDFNLSQFDDLGIDTTPTSGMPGTWNKGTDIPFPIDYFIDPDNYWPTPYMLTALSPLALDGDDATFESGSKIDFILNSPTITPLGSEIYRSQLDVDNTAGLPKAGGPLNPTVGPDPFENDSTTASDHYAVFADFDLDEQEYVFTTPTGKVTENFDSFDGNDDPVNWTSSPITTWNGTDDGSSPTFGGYAYGTSENALGSLPGSTTSFTSQYRNNTGSAISAMQISYDAEQWRAVSGGSADTWSVELIIDEVPTVLAPLTFTADTTGSAPPGTATPLSAMVTNLSILDDEAFQLRFTATPGPGAGTPVDEVFINEFHYDNISTDSGEFVEVVIAPGFTGTSSDIAVYFYNGNGGGTYGPTSVSLSPSTLDATVNGYEIHELFQSGIQNGDPDGLAVVDTRDDSVLQFISYEGTFTATAGPASGMTSVDVGEEQSNSSTPVGEESIGLTGTGSSEANFTWELLTGQAHTPGQLNPGQSLVPPGLPAQGLAIDNLSVCLIVDHMPPEITDISVNLSTQTGTLTFIGAAGVTDWQVLGSSNLSLGFPDDRTPAFFTESPAGTYTADLDLTDAGSHYFLRIVRP